MKFSLIAVFQIIRKDGLMVGYVKKAGTISIEKIEDFDEATTKWVEAQREDVDYPSRVILSSLSHVLLPD